MKTPVIDTKLINTLPVFLSCTLISLWVYFTNDNNAAPALMLGIIAGGLVDLDNGLTGKLKNLLFTLLTFAISSLSVQMAFHSAVGLTLTFTVLAFVFTYVGAAGVRFRTIAFGTLAVAIYTTLTHNPHAAWYLNTIMILLGTLVYSAWAVLIHVAFPHRPVQENMANAYDSLARYLNAKAEFFNPDEIDQLAQQQTQLAMLNSQVSQTFNQCRSALFYRMRGQHRHPRTARMLHYYFVAQDIHERISSSHVDYQTFAREMEHTDFIFRIRWLLTQQAHACRDVAQALRNNHEYMIDEKINRATSGAYQSLKYYSDKNQNIDMQSIRRLLDNVSCVTYQLSHLANPQLDDYAIHSDKTRIYAPEQNNWRHVSGSLKQHFTVKSSVFRHAVRMAMVAFVCVIVIQLIHALGLNQNDLSAGFWILLTAVFVCQPNYSTTQNRVIERIIGTAGGVLVGSILPLLSVGLADKLVVASLATVLFFFFRTHKYRFSTFFITIQALTGFSIIGLDIAHFFWARFLDTIIGAGIAGVAVYHLWPDWKYVSLERIAVSAVHSNAGYLSAVLNELEQGISDDVQYRLARRNSYDQAATLSSIVSDLASEPNKHGERVQTGFSLLNTHYSLISHIAALGAYRDKMVRDNSEFLQQFNIISHQIINLLKKLVDLSYDDFQAAYTPIQENLTRLSQLFSPNHHEQNQILWQQMSAISNLLPHYYQALHHTFRQPENTHSSLQKVIL